jgi:16S rRNA (guanine527-N7)-methyltransferase
LDIGSGAGIPGLIIAIAMPQLKVTLVESDQKKCAFLVEARRVVGCKNVEILADRVESIEGTWDVITARAVTKLKELLFWKSLVGHKNTVGLWLKGKEWREELEDAKTMFVFDSVITPSITETNSVLITTKSSQLKAG